MINLTFAVELLVKSCDYFSLVPSFLSSNLPQTAQKYKNIAQTVHLTLLGRGLYFRDIAATQTHVLLAPICQRLVFSQTSFYNRKQRRAHPFPLSIVSFFPENLLPVLVNVWKAPPPFPPTPFESRKSSSDIAYLTSTKSR